MQKYIVKRLKGFALVLIGVSLLSFLLVILSGRDPAEVIARRGNINATQEMIQEIREDMGLDKTVVTRYINWIRGLFTGDLGISIYSYRPIAQDLAEYFPVTLLLVNFSILWIIVLSLPISLLSARFRNSTVDQVIRGVTIVGICIPSFWLGFLLLLAFAIKVPLFRVLPEPGLKGYILPSFALALPVACSIIRLFRASLLTEFSRDYVLYARARGLSATRILICHILRNAFPPIITVFCQYLGYLIAGGAVVENIFSLKGVGTYLIGCVIASDTIAVAVCIVIVAGIFVITNLAGDIINRILCPWMVRGSNV